MCGDTRDRDPQFPSPAEENLSPAIEPGLQNDLAEEALSNKVSAEKERIEYSALG